MLQVPRVAHRRVHVAQVQLAGPGDHALGDGVVGRNDQIVGRQVELLDGQRHQRQVAAKARARERQALDEGGGGVLAAHEGALLGREEIDHAEQVGIEVDLQDLLDHLFAAGVADKPFVDDGDLHHQAQFALKIPSNCAAALAQLNCRARNSPSVT